ncbi:hypothetical protein KAI04_03370 [Candidatus Pacearchaeota archaeon]|nr:hypothetical protein [Candidatus Pacearchaeota archaeon]
MTIKHGDQTYMTDNDLTIKIMGLWPSFNISNPELKKEFEKKFGRGFLGGDDLVSYAQPLVSSGMDFEKLEETIFGDMYNEEGKNFEDILFNKTATGIGRGHSLGGLSGVVLGVHGTKMIDSGLTGLCSSRSLVTSSRRRETGTADIAIPESLQKHPKLLKKYMQISEEVFNLGKEFKEKFGKMGGVETFNKVIPYNNPADLFIVLPLDTMATITAEVREDALNPNGTFLPREIHALSAMFPEITKEIGQSTMYKQRIEVPRDNYMHYNVFKDPGFPNHALELGTELGLENIDPLVVNTFFDNTKGFRVAANYALEAIKQAQKSDNPKELHEKSLEAMYALRKFANEYNESVRIQIGDTLSWRVWSEQKRHSTLRQTVESVYSGAERALKGITPLWPTIEVAYNENDFEKLNGVLSELEKNIIIDNRLKRKPEVIIPYAYHTAKQLMLYQEFLDAGIPARDALFAVPKNIRLRTSENYDLTNLIDLEFPLRLCNTCEPERKASSWKKREIIVEELPDLEPFLKSKCNVGFCTEGKYCNQITDMREYDEGLHKATKQYMLDKAK